MAGLSATAYLFSKVLVLGVISVLQTLLIVVVGLAGLKVPSSGVLHTRNVAHRDLRRASRCCAWCPCCIGLAISTLVTKSDQTMPILVGVTMVQVALSGGMFPLTGAVQYVSMIAPARWGMGALASTINLNVINPQNPAPADPARRPVGAHRRAVAHRHRLLIVIGLIWMVIARLRLATIGPRRRKHGSAPAGRDSGQPAASTVPDSRRPAARVIRVAGRFAGRCGHRRSCSSS